MTNRAKGILDKEKLRDIFNKDGNSTFAMKILYFMVAAPVVLLLGMIFPGVAHIVWTVVAVQWYKEIFE